MSVSVLNTTASLTGKTLAKLEDTQTFTGQKTFDVGASAPFVCISGSAKVSNLDADKLDGQEGTYYTNASNIDAGTLAIARYIGADPNADRLHFWDDSVGAAAFLTTVNSTPNGTNIIFPLSDPCGRLTLTSATPVTTADVTAAGTLYWALYKGNTCQLYNATTWETFSLAELSVAAPAAANQMYDCFLDYNAGTPQLVLLAWTNDTTRATALTTQNGRLVKTGATGQLFVGSVRTVTASQFNDSIALRHVWNFYHRIDREMLVLETENTYDYSTATWRQMQGDTANQLDFIIGVSEDTVEANVSTTVVANGQAEASVAIGIDSTTVPSTKCLRGASQPPTTMGMPVLATLRTASAIGRHTWVALEIVNNLGGGVTVTWRPDNGSTSITAGIAGVLRG